MTTTGNNSIGLYATGTGSSITTINPTATGPVTITTTGSDSNGVQADNGGAVTLNGGSVTTSGVGSFGLWASGAGSTIAASNVAVATQGGVDTDTGNYPIGVFAGGGGLVTFSGGSITTSGASADAVVSQGSGSSVTLSGGTTIQTTGIGSAGLVVNGSGASATANGVSITTHGANDPSDGFLAFGAYNGSSGVGLSSGGTMKLTDTTILTTGFDGFGIDTNSGGVTTVVGGSVTTSGDHAIGVLTQGSGTSASLTGTTISTAGNASTGVELNGTGSSLALSGVTITTTGSYDPTTGFYTQGFYNGTNGDRDRHWRRRGDDREFLDLDKRGEFIRDPDSRRRDDHRQRWLGVDLRRHLERRRNPRLRNERLADRNSSIDHGEWFGGRVACRDGIVADAVERQHYDLRHDRPGNGARRGRDLQWKRIIGGLFRRRNADAYQLVDRDERSVQLRGRYRRLRHHQSLRRLDHDVRRPVRRRPRPFGRSGHRAGNDDLDQRQWIGNGSKGFDIQGAGTVRDRETA